MKQLPLGAARQTSRPVYAPTVVADCTGRQERIPSKSLGPDGKDGQRPARPQGALQPCRTCAPPAEAPLQGVSKWVCIPY